MEANLLLWIQENLRGALDPVICGITHLGDAGIFWIVLTLLLLAMKKTRRLGIFCAAALLMDLLLVNILIKPLVARPRPYDVIPGLTSLVGAESDFSFPSGHSAASFACAWMLFRLEKRRGSIAALCLAGVIALSRLYVGVHYPTDVLFGVLFGMLAAEIVLWGLPRLIALWQRRKA